MPEVVCNITPLQYLHQAGVLWILPKLYGRVLIPKAVMDKPTQENENHGLHGFCRDPYDSRGSECAGVPGAAIGSTGSLTLATASP